ncbi:MAG: hypothetical protein KJ007_14600 [Burkholderiales bacterium]|nr:hypothetical protein [Burkholderiales bacterium]
MPAAIRPEYFWATLWAAVVLLLGGALAAEHFVGGVDVGQGAHPPARVADARLLPSFALPPEPQPASETVTRPLFVPTRRPSPPAPAAAASAMKRGQFVLMGVTITPEASFAFLKEVAGGKTHSVRKGSQVSGITVDTVEPRRVVLRQGEEREDLPLNVQVPARTAQAPGTVPPGATPGSAGPSSLPRPGMPGAPAPAAPGAPVPAATAPQAAPGIPAPAAPVTGRRRPWINAQ